MITCYIRYIIDPYKIEQFKRYGQLWIKLVNKFGGNHLGYFLPHEGDNNVAIAMFNFPSLAEYEKYRIESLNNEECIAAYDYANQGKFIISYERSFFKPLELK